MEKNSSDTGKEIDDIIKGCLGNVSKVMKSANSLPLTDYDYWTIDKDFTNAISTHTSNIVQLVQYLLGKHGFKNKLHNRMDDEDIYTSVTSICDQLMERISSNLDEAAGLKPTNKLLLVSKTSPDPTTKPTLLTQKSMPKPQNSFKDKVDNSSAAFKPPITHKPHALIPLEESLVLMDGEYTHPYSYEIQMLKMDPQMAAPCKPTKPGSMEDTPLSYIDTHEQLMRFIEEVQGVSELAVDLEHHSFRSYQGFTCLMQLSTRKADYIIDTIALRHHLNILNSIFADPSVVKVLHGMDSDVEWLQKDLGVYVVNAFDTSQAARVLSLPHFSLAYLLKTICGITADKQYQRADWRIRPLPETHLRYAREDTHYLLYIYDVVRGMLRERGEGLVEEVFEKSREICLKKYTKAQLTDNSHKEWHSRKVAKGAVPLSNKGLEVLRRIHTWRDKLARTEDESTGYILPDEILYQISSQLPLSEADILKCCKTYVPPTLKVHLQDIKLIIQDVVTYALHETETKEDKQEDKEGDVIDDSSSAPFTCDFVHSDDYDDSFLKSSAKVDSDLDSITSKSVKHIKEASILKKIFRFYLPYLPTHLVPKEYRAQLKVKFLASTVVTAVLPKQAVQPEKLETEEEIKFNAVPLRNKIKEAKKESTQKEEKTINDDDKDKNNKKSNNNIKEKNNNNKNNNKDNNTDFKAKIYEKKELKTMIKEETTKKKASQGDKRDADDDTSNQPTPAKRKRQSFHKSNKSYSFKPSK